MADIFTKGLAKVQFAELSDGIGLTNNEKEHRDVQRKGSINITESFANIAAFQNTKYEKKTYEGSQPFTIFVEGNIGSGKSTFLEYFKHHDDVCIITEPIHKWRHFHGINLLERMYKDPLIWAQPFQSYVTLSMLQAHTTPTNRKIKIMERSIYSAKNCFVEALYNDRILEEGMYYILHEWFDYIERNIHIQADLMVYLRCTPQTAFDRLKKRGRTEENMIDINYLRKIHELHENWLINGENQRAPIFIIDADLEGEQIIEEYLRLKFYLEQMKQ